MRISLEKFLAKKSAQLLRRREWKFIVPRENENLIARFLRDDFLQIFHDDRETFFYRNFYFDTADFRLLKLHRTGRRNRVKIRVRAYENGKIKKFLECKKKIAPREILKLRREIASDFDFKKIADEKFVAENLQNLKISPTEISSKMEIFYARKNFVSRDFRARISFDFDICAKCEKGERELLENFFVLEIKSEKFPKKIIQFLAHNLKIRATRISKYCVAACALNEDLSKTRWRKIFKKYRI